MKTRRSMYIIHLALSIVKFVENFWSCFLFLLWDDFWIGDYNKQKKLKTPTESPILSNF